MARLTASAAKGVKTAPGVEQSTKVYSMVCTGFSANELLRTGGERLVGLVGRQPGDQRAELVAPRVTGGRLLLSAPSGLRREGQERLPEARRPHARNLTADRADRAT